MKKLLANASKYTYNKMAKTAYFWYYWGVSSVYFLKKQTKRALFHSLAISVVENEPTLESTTTQKAATRRGEEKLGVG